MFSTCTPRGLYMLAACLSLAGVTRAADGGENDIRLEIERALARTKAAISAVEIDFHVTERFCRGCFTDSAKADFPTAVSGPVPPGDVVLEYDCQVLLDFNSPRQASKGFEGRARLILGENDTPALDAYTQWRQKSFDGVHNCSLRPKDRTPSRVLPPGIKHPVEFVRNTLDDGGASLYVDEHLYPVSFWAGAIFPPDQQLMAEDRRAQCKLDQWKVEGPVRLDGKELVVLTSPPTGSGSYCQFYLLPLFDYRPAKWVQYAPTGARRVMESEYVKDNGAVPRLSSWTMHSCNSTGALVKLTHYAVTATTVNPALKDDQFILEPTDGMVVEELEGPNYTGVHVAGRPELKAWGTEELDAAIARPNGSYSWLWVGISAAGVMAIIGAFLAWLGHEFCKRERINDQCDITKRSST